MPSDSPHANRWITCSVAIVCGMFLVGLLCGGLVLYATLPPHPHTVFSSVTGQKCPAEATVVSTADSHGGFLGDGEYHLILRVPPETIPGLLKRDPAAPLPGWAPGPVPTEIGSHCRFGFDHISIQSMGGGPMEYRGDNELVEVLTSDQIYYSAHDRCCESLAWHNGTLVVLNPQSDTVWISIWDF